MKDRTNALIGLASENDLRIALHYEKSARILYSSKEYQDGIVLPFLFLVRQFLELGLKYNISRLNEVSSSDFLSSSLNKEHDLCKLHQGFLQHYRDVVKSSGAVDLSDEKLLDALETLVEKVSVLDEKSQGFRYSTDKAGVKIIDNEKNFNLKDVFDLLEDVSDLLAHTKDVLIPEN